MIELTMSLWDLKDNRFEVPFYLMSVPTQTPDDAKLLVYDEPNYGKWYCTSPYLGQKALGKYFFKNVVLPQCSVEQTWADACPHVLNPIGYFFDMDGVNPFLVLQAFNPMTPSHREEYGDIKLMYITGVHTGVRWIQQ
jgi:hypothetical protein